MSAGIHIGHARIMENLNLQSHNITAPTALTLDHIIFLFTKTYNHEGRPDWSHIIPFYDDKIKFRDSVQEINGIVEFREMTERLAKRSGDLKMKVVNASQHGNIFFLEWEMTIAYKKYPSSVLHGASRIKISEAGKIIEQRDYYDLWGDIFDNIPWFGKKYRKFMRKKFG